MGVSYEWGTVRIEAAKIPLQLIADYFNALTHNPTFSAQNPLLKT